MSECELSEARYPHSADAIRLASLLREASSSQYASRRYLIFVRGLPGSGKSTLAKYLVKDVCSSVIASDDDHIAELTPRSGHINIQSIQEASQAGCKQKVWSALYARVLAVVVDNPNIQFVDMEPYLMEGIKHGYEIHLIEPNTPWRYSPPKLIRATAKSLLTVDELKSMLDCYRCQTDFDAFVKHIRYRLNSIMTQPTGTVDRLVIPPQKSDDSLPMGQSNPADEDKSSRVSQRQMDYFHSSPNEPTSMNSISIEDDNQLLPPSPSTSGSNEDHVKQLATIFPSLNPTTLQEYIDLAQGDLQWASSLILENQECKRTNPDQSTSDLVHSASVSENPPPMLLDQQPIDEQGGGDAPPDVMDLQSTEVTDPTSNSPQTTRSSASGLSVSRQFIQKAHDLYAFAYGLSSLDLSSDVIPDFIFDEWDPEPDVVRTVYLSFMRHLGLYDNLDTIPPRSGKPKGKMPCNLTDRLRKRSAAQNPKYPTQSSQFSEIIQQDEAFHRSIQDYRSSLDAPAVRCIINRLMSNFKGIERSTVEEEFVKSNFSESVTEALLSMSYGAKEIPGCSSLNNAVQESSLVTESTNYDMDKLTLSEVQAEEEAIQRSIEDQRMQLQSLSNQLSLCRLKSQFPGIHESQLECLFVTFDMDELKLVNHLKSNGYTAHPIAPLIVTETTEHSVGPNEPSTTSDPKLIACKVRDIRQRIGSIRHHLSNQSDRRILSYHKSELNRLHRTLKVLLVERAEHLVSERSDNYFKHPTLNSDLDKDAMCKVTDYVDLHGIDKSSAMLVLRSRLSRIESMLTEAGRSQRSRVIVITGRGGSSEADCTYTAPILRPAVINFFQSKGYDFTERYRAGSGCFIVQLPPKK